MADICGLCRGSGSFFFMQEMPEWHDKKLFRWATCSFCNGLGTVRATPPATIKMPTSRKGKMKNWPIKEVEVAKGCIKFTEQLIREGRIGT